MKPIHEYLVGALTASDGIDTIEEQYNNTQKNVIAHIKGGHLNANKRIAGIPCPDELTTGKMLTYFQEENLSIMEIKDALRKLGLPFRAIVRTAFYNQIKQQKGIYTFENIDENGFVSISENNTERFIGHEVEKFNKKTSTTVLVTQIVVSVILALLLEWGLCALTWDKPDFWANFWATNIVIMWWAIAIVCRCACWLTDFLITRFIFTPSLLCKKIEHRISKQSLSIFWPTYTDYAEGPKVKIDFITPPPHIASDMLLWKNAGYTLHISAQKEAFSLNIQSIKNFLEVTVDAVLEEIKRKRELELKAKIEAWKLFWQKFDPIISTQIGEFTVLIDAYGGKSFVSEAEVVGSVISYYNDKLKEFQTILN